MSRTIRLVDGRRVQLWQGGAAHGPVVFFMHGCPDSRWAAWLGDLPARRVGVRLVAVNRPGYGASDAHASTPRTVADDTVTVAEALGVSAFAVLGMSVGGLYALATAACHPDRVTAVATVATPGQVAVMQPPYHRDGLSPEQAAELDVLRATPTPEDAVRLLRPGYEEFLEGFRRMDGRRLAARWTAELSPPEQELVREVPGRVVTRQAQEALTQPDGYLRDAAAMFRPWEFDPSRVRCPVTVVHGARDTQASPRNARWLADNVPGARLLRGVDDTHLGALHTRWDELLTVLAPTAGSR